MSRNRHFLDVQLPFFRPLWLRVAVTGACFAMAVLDFLRGEMFWVILFGALAVYCFYQFFVVFDPVDPDEEKES